MRELPALRLSLSAGGRPPTFFMTKCRGEVQSAGDLDFEKKRPTARGRTLLRSRDVAGMAGGAARLLQVNARSTSCA